MYDILTGDKMEELKIALQMGWLSLIFYLLRRAETFRDFEQGKGF